MPDVAISWYDLSSTNAVLLGHRLKTVDRHDIYGRRTLYREWCSAQRIQINMIAGGNHTLIYCRVASLLAMTRWSGLVAPIETVR